MRPGEPSSGPEESIAVPDAILAVRTFPRRYREALARILADQLRVRPDPQTPSVLETTADAATVFEQLARALPLALDEPGIQLPSLDAAGSSGTRPASSLDADAALARIATACDALATRAGATPWEAWERTFTAGGEPHPASWIVQHAAVEGSQHLRDIERVGRLVGARDADD